MTSAEAIARAADDARVLIEHRPEVELVDESGHAIDVPVVLVNAHGGPWVIHPDPRAILGWLAAQIDLHEDGFTILPGTYGWLGAGDVEPDRLIANLTEADRLPTNIWMTDHTPTRHRAITGPDTQHHMPYRTPTEEPDNERSHRWNR
jgi:hypothetical protein